MIPIDEASEIIRRQTVPLPSERVGIERVVGRVLAEDIRADMDLPPFDRSQMDGFAVRTGDVTEAPARLRIAGESAAGRGWPGELGSGEAVRIMTGAPVPNGADAVQKVEVTDEKDGFVTLLEAPRAGQNIVRRAEEVRRGELVFEKGARVTKNMVASLASFGHADVNVARRPRVSILATGSEIVDISETPGRDQIRNSNTWSLRAFAEEAADVTLLPPVRDEPEHLTETISEAAADCDVLLISGGVSVGDYDFTKPAMRAAGAEIFFEKIALKPGKPTVFGRLGETLVFGLPGNPVSIAVTFYAFVRTALLLMQSASAHGLREGRAVLTHDLRGARGRDSLLPVSLSTGEDGKLLVETLRFSGSSNFIRFAAAEALVFVPREETLGKGAVARIYHLP